MNHRKKVLVSLLLSLALLTVGTASSCDSPQQATGGAKLVTDLGFKIPKNAAGYTTEQQNIIDRINVTSDPTKVMWIHLITLDGKIIQRMPVAHKITSSGKRLEPITAAQNSYGFPSYLAANGYTYATSEFLQPDGTMGQSDAYVFWFDPQHRYHQWGTAGGLGYLLTDYPIDLRSPQDLISGMYNMDKAAFEWQKLREIDLQKEQDALCQAKGKGYTKYVEGECK